MYLGFGPKFQFSWSSCAAVYVTLFLKFIFLCHKPQSLPTFASYLLFLLISITRVQVSPPTTNICVDDVMMTLKWCMNSSQDITWKQINEYHVNKGFSGVVAWLGCECASSANPALLSGSLRQRTINHLMLQPASHHKVRPLHMYPTAPCCRCTVAAGRERQLQLLCNFSPLLFIFISIWKFCIYTRCTSVYIFVFCMTWNNARQHSVKLWSFSMCE